MPDEEQTYASYAIPYSSDSWRIFSKHLPVPKIFILSP